MLSLKGATVSSGWAKQELTPFPMPMVMMGWGDENNIAKTQATPLQARAVIFATKTKKLCFLYLDIGFITDIIYRRILSQAKGEGLIQTEDELWITASHTHSGPGGINEHLYYEIPTPGFQENVVDRIIDVSIATLKEAHSDLADCRVFFAKRAFPSDVPVAFNRSVDSYIQNVEIDDPASVTPINAIDRTMFQWNILKEGKSAVINWFGVHGTCLSKERSEYHFDNKGYACQEMEKELGADSVAIFAQASAGDVTPHNAYDKEMTESRGDYDLEDRYAQKIGGFQAKLSKEIFDEKGIELSEEVLVDTSRCNYSQLENGKLYTTSASFGLAMIRGTKEGPGIPAGLAILLKGIIKISKAFQFLLSSGAKRQSLIAYYQAQGNKDVFINAGERKLLGVPIENKVYGLELIDPVIKKMNKLLKKQPYKAHNSWLEESSYFSVMLWGPVVVVGLPFELSSMASFRIKRALKKHNSKIQDVIVNGYSFSYMGYMITPEEYENQNYEGGHSVFGKWLLPLVIKDLESKLDRLLKQ